MRKIKGRRLRPNNTQNLRAAKSIHYLLESGSLVDMRAAKQVTTEHLKYHWDFYSELARQRNPIEDKIKNALIQTCIPYEIQHWQRAVKYKYSLHPLSVMGSLVFIGGRFNTGKGVNSEVPNFPGLYLALDKETALQEHLGQEPVPKGSELSALDIALTNPASETIVSISGKIDKVFDLTNADNLNPFIDLIKNFKISKNLKLTARQLNITCPEIIKTSKKLLETLLCCEWRQLPSNYDVPANSQIFGHLIYSAGIEGILYPSKFTNKPCLVIFPRNFSETDSYVILDDEAPHIDVPKRIDNQNWRITELDILF
jgi:RES domain-containing protein